MTLRAQASSGGSREAGPAPCLVAGDAIAVLFDVEPNQPRDAAAQHALGQATGRHDIVVGRRPSGRPRLEPPYAELGVSIAGRGPRSVAAFSPTCAVGVDLEVDVAGRPFEPARFSADHFAAAETRLIAALSPAVARTLVLRLWVIKEAALKATGRGVVDGLAWPDLSDLVDRLAGDEARWRPIGLDHGRLAVSMRSLARDQQSEMHVALAVLRAADG